MKIRLSCPSDLLSSAHLRLGAKMGIDLALALLALAVTQSLSAQLWLTLWVWPLWALWALSVSAALDLYRQHYRCIGFRDFSRLALAFSIFTLGASWAWSLARLGPLTLCLLASLLTFTFWAAIRALIRSRHEAVRACGIDAKPTLIIGAGHAGLLVAQEIQRHPELGSRLVGFLDDSLAKQGLSIHGYPVLGTPELLPYLVEEYAIEIAILAIPSASGQELRRLTDLARSVRIQIKTVPGIYDLLGQRSWKPELRNVSIEDLLRREPIKLEQGGLRSIVENQVVLVTGAGGSIGSELARQLCQLQPKQLILLGRGENSLWEIERELRKSYPEQTFHLELCDIRNARRLDAAFDRWLPSIVFHAAAHKHVPFLEQHPEEAIENNVFGTSNVLEAALRIGVKHFVNVSTDKAVNPTNVLGVSKRLAELIVAEGAKRAPGDARYASVRFGNVLGSRGSVVKIFKDQIQKGGPITITHPDMTRYFMTIPEASQLVIQAGLLGETGKVYVLDMGQSVKIVDLARDMISLSGFEPEKDIQIHFTGARPGEKLFEELFHGQTQPKASNVHPKVFEAKMDKDAFSTQQALYRLQVAVEENAPHAEMVELFQDLVPTYQPAQNGLKALTKEEATTCAPG